MPKLQPWFSSERLDACASDSFTYTPTLRVDDRPFTHEIQLAFSENKFDVLEHNYNEITHKKLRDASGNMRLENFYQALDESIEGSPQERGYDKGRLLQVAMKIAKWKESYPHSLAAKHARIRLLFTELYKMYYDPTASYSTYDTQINNVIKELAILLGPDLNGIKEDQAADLQFTSMMTEHHILALTRGNNTYDDILESLGYTLNRSLTLHPDYPRNYYYAMTYAVWLRTPREFSELAKLADKAATATASTDGKSLAARIYHEFIRQRGVDTGLFAPDAADWPHAKTAFDDLVTRYPTEQNDNIYAELACVAHDKNTMNGQLKKLKGAYNAVFWVSSQFMQKCQRDAQEISSH